MSALMIDQVIKFFIVFFVVVEPLSIAPVFVSLTKIGRASCRERVCR